MGPAQPRMEEEEEKQQKEARFAAMGQRGVTLGGEEQKKMSDAEMREQRMAWLNRFTKK